MNRVLMTRSALVSLAVVAALSLMDYGSGRGFHLLRYSLYAAGNVGLLVSLYYFDGMRRLLGFWIAMYPVACGGDLYPAVGQIQWLPNLIIAVIIGSSLYPLVWLIPKQKENHNG